MSNLLQKKKLKKHFEKEVIYIVPKDSTNLNSFEIFAEVRNFHLNDNVHCGKEHQVTGECFLCNLSPSAPSALRLTTFVLRHIDTGDLTLDDDQRNDRLLA